MITDSLGNLVRGKTFQSDDDLLYHVCLPLANGDIVFAGEIQWLNSQWSHMIITRTDSLLNTPPIGVRQISTRTPASFRLYQNFPNPFNSSTIIRFDLSMFSDIKLTIYDLLGREIKIVEEERLPPGSYEINWNPENCSSGIYFYQLSTEQNRESRKMLLIK